MQTLLIPDANILYYSLKVVSRPVDTTTLTSGLLFLGYEIWASEEARATKHKPSSAYNYNRVLTLCVQYTAWASTVRLVYRKKPVLYPKQPASDTFMPIDKIRLTPYRRAKEEH